MNPAFKERKVGKDAIDKSSNFSKSKPKPKESDEGPNKQLLGRQPKNYRKAKKTSPKRITDVETAGKDEIMEYEGRKVDLSAFRADTPLYPVCRAWMKNKPFESENQRQRKPVASSPPPSRKDNGEELLAKVKSGKITKIMLMPKIGPEVCARIPAPLVFDEEIVSTDDIMKRLETENDVKVGENCKKRSDEKRKEYTKEELLEVNMTRWKKMKAHWISYINEYNRRYDVNRQILEHICSKDFKNM